MTIEESAKILLSGEYARRRGYLNTIINSWDQVALTASVAIWAFTVRWDALLRTPPEPELFAVQIAWAGALTSVLVGFWRLYARYLDDAIIALYPAVYLCERALMPPEVCTLKPPENVLPLSRSDVAAGVAYVPVHNIQFKSRGHAAGDWIAVTVIVFFASLNVTTAAFLRVVAVPGGATAHRMGALLLGNALGIVLIAAGYLRWKNQCRQWPVPMNVAQQAAAIR